MLESKNWKKKMKSSEERHNINVEMILDYVEIAMNAKIEARYALALRPASGYRKGWEAATIMMKEILRDKLLG